MWWVYAVRAVMRAARVYVPVAWVSTPLRAEQEYHVWARFSRRERRCMRRLRHRYSMHAAAGTTDMACGGPGTSGAGRVVVPRPVASSTFSSRCTVVNLAVLVGMKLLMSCVIALSTTLVLFCVFYFLLVGCRLCLFLGVGLLLLFVGRAWQCVKSLSVRLYRCRAWSVCFKILLVGLVWTVVEISGSLNAG